MALKIVRGLRALGADVWWDEDMPGVDWQLELDRQIHELGCVVVLWTTHSVNSRHVRDEARLADSCGKLINALDGVSKPSFPFDRVNGLPLDSWDGRGGHNGWERLVKTVEDHLVKNGMLKPGELSAALDRYERDIRRKQQAVERAEEAFQVAKALEDETEAARLDTTAALEASEGQLRRISELQASSRLLVAAQAEFDECRNAKLEAEKARKAAAAGLATASRALARARADLARMFAEPEPPDDPDAAPLEEDQSPRSSASMLEREVELEAAPVTTPVARTPEPDPEPVVEPDPIAEAAPEPVFVAPPPPPPPIAPPPSPPAVQPAAATVPPPAAKRLNLLLPLAGGGAAIVTLLLVTMLMQPHKAPQAPAPAPAASTSQDANAAAAAADSAAQTASAATPSDPDDAAFAQAQGNWSGSGSTCDSPFKVAFAADPENAGAHTVSVTMMDSTSSGGVQSVQSDGTVLAKMSDGVWTYRGSGQNLSVTAPGGAKLSYTRCAN